MMTKIRYPHGGGRERLPALASLTALVLLTACSGGQPGDPNNRGLFRLTLASTGLGQIFPYRINKLAPSGNPTQEILNIEKIETLKANLSSVNGVLPLATWSTTATLPNGNPGNQFLLLKFSHTLKIASILSTDPANQSNSGLTGALQIVELDPATESAKIVTGRAFVGGYTYYDDPATPVFDLKLVRAVKADDKGKVTILDSRASGFPTGFSGDEALVQPNTMVFIPDADGDLTTFETFPKNRVIRILVTSAVLDYRDKPITEEVCTATTVGPDTIAPEVSGSKSGPLKITPGGGKLDVDPTTTISVSFTKPVQPFDVGEFFSTTNKVPAFRGVTLNMTIANVNSPVLYYADPLNASDFCNYTLTPAYTLPSSTLITVQVNNTINGLPGVSVGSTVSTKFSTGKGPGLVNAPVAPEAIYVGRGGDSPGLSVIDLNGFGQGTGDLTKSNFPNNPNIGQPGVQPTYSPGRTNLDAGGEGVLTLTKSTTLSTLLVDKTLISDVGDIQLGQPLDKVFNNENINPFATRANQVNPYTQSPVKAWGNSISAPPIPNPPKLVFPPPNPARAIFAEEPTVASTGSQGCQTSPGNKLVKGNPFSTGVDRGLYHTSFPGVFYGPNPPPGSPQPPTPFCPYSSRQQIGHFLYVLDRAKKQVLVFNSNRFTLLETIRISDPYSMAVSPNLKRLAVTNFSAGTVVFIDIDPSSPSFHQIVHEERVGKGPAGLAWQPEGEDLLVCNSLSDSLSIINGADLQLRKTVIGQMNRPIEVAVTLRQNGVGFNTGTYYGFILNSDGTIAIYESGPDGINGIGYNQVIGIPDDAHFRAANTIQPDIKSFVSGIWVAHQDSLGVGQVSHLELTSSPTGNLPIDASALGFILPPTFRQRVWSITGRIGGSNASNSNFLSGNNVIDIAIDELSNFGAYPDTTSIFVGNLVYADHSGKGQGKVVNGQVLPAIDPRFLFVGLADSGKVDVVELDTGKIVRTIPVPGVRVLSSYWRQ